MLRKEAHFAQRKMAAGAAALRRKCAPSAHFFVDAEKSRKNPGKTGSKPQKTA